MSDYLVSLIRTGVPAAVGAALAWLTTSGLDVAADDRTAIAAGATVALTAVYYGLVRALEKRWPLVGVLLGRATPPTYTPHPPRDE